MRITRRDCLVGAAGISGLLARESAGGGRSRVAAGIEAAQRRLTITVRIDVVDGQLKASLDPIIREAMLARKAADPAGEEMRRNRMPYGALADHGHDSDPDHVTIVLSESLGDIVEWVSSQDLVVDVGPDPGLVAIPGTPRSPFGWMLPERGRPGAGGFKVSATMVPNGGAVRQRFYKYTVWTAGLQLDPDISCSP